jgi:hypothetical protein
VPEIWVPYGDVEAMVTLQAENLGGITDPEAEKGTEEAERLAEKLKKTSHLFVCDSNPTTIELLKSLTSTLAATPELKIHSANPKRLEAAISDLKGRVTPPPDSKETKQVGQELSEAGEKLFVATARPDPLYGLIDARVATCLGWIGGAREAAVEARKDFEPTPFERTEGYEALNEMASKIGEASFLTVVPRAGRVRSALEDAPFETIRNGFYSASVAQSRAMIVGAGGRGYDDTLSSALRSIWACLSAVRKPGEVLLLAECSGGLGSKALEMLVSGRIGGEVRKREKYVPGLEEVYYLNKLKEEYGVIVMSGLPELYARSKLGFTTAKGSSEALGKLLHRLGKTTKVNVVTRAAECRLTLAQGN